MTMFELVTVANFVLTWGVLLLLALNLFPQLRQGLAVVRDAVLWCALLVVVGFLAWHGWSEWLAPSSTRADRSTGTGANWQAWSPLEDPAGSVESWPAGRSGVENPPLAGR